MRYLLLTLSLIGCGSPSALAPQNGPDLLPAPSVDMGKTDGATAPIKRDMTPTPDMVTVATTPDMTTPDMTPTCGTAVGQACCDNHPASLYNTCDPAYWVICPNAAGPTCAPCGGIGQTCCVGNLCRGDSTTIACSSVSGTVDKCVHCGNNSEPCCTAGPACSSGLVCASGECG